jgi:Uma2 family endonuclease
MSYADYLSREATRKTRHEFMSGEVFAMAGGTPEHAGLAAATIRELGIALRGKPCRVYSSDVRVRVVATGLATYPDATVVCGHLETDRRNERDRWELIEGRPSDPIDLASLGVALEVDGIYANPLNT